MSVWVILGWEETYGNWEVLSVLFDEKVVEVKLHEIFDCDPTCNQIKVECWHRDYADSPDASFYDVETFCREDFEMGE